MVSPCVYKTNGHFWKWKLWMVSKWSISRRVNYCTDNRSDITFFRIALVRLYIGQDLKIGCTRFDFLWKGVQMSNFQYFCMCLTNKTVCPFHKQGIQQTPIMYFWLIHVHVYICTCTACMHWNLINKQMPKIFPMPLKTNLTWPTYTFNAFKFQCMSQYWNDRRARVHSTPPPSPPPSPDTDEWS